MDAADDGRLLRAVSEGQAVDANTSLVQPPQGSDTWTSVEGLQDLARELSEIRSEMLGAEERYLSMGGRWPKHRRSSVRNLLHYLALRRRDRRTLQTRLAALGLSSLGRAESQALAGVQAVLDIVLRLAATSDASPLGAPAPRAEGRGLLEANARALLGDPPSGRDVRIMVTMPSEAADDYALVQALVAAGMDCARINTAHDDRAVWERIVAHVERARTEVGRACRVLVDLPGPKLRTGPILPRPPVVKWRPKRDEYGHLTRHARIWLTAVESPVVAPGAADATLTVAATWLATLGPGDLIKFLDTRDSMRAVRVAARGDGGVWGESDQTAYVVGGTLLHATHVGSGAPVGASVPDATSVGPMPSVSQVITLRKGDSLVLTKSLSPGTPAVCDETGAVVTPAVVGVTLPQVFADIRAGEAIWLDDGKIGGVIRTVSEDRVEVTVTYAKENGSKLGPDKGINLPDSDLRLPALTSADIEALAFVAERADLVGYSFVRTEDDVRELQARLGQFGRDIGIVLKIETRRAFERLPALLLAAMRSPASGVMIARGDLAVECGYERLAEVQEEILWLAEASHTPVIWATQVLETLAKAGIPSRAEVTDAAMGERAECVMLNKGPHIVEAVAALDDILTRMEAHQRKKSAMLRRLGVAERFLEG